MKTLLLLTVFGTLLIAIGLTGMNYGTRNRITEVKTNLDALVRENANLRRQIRIMQERAANHSDKVEIVYTPDDKSVPGYKNF